MAAFLASRRKLVALLAAAAPCFAQGRVSEFLGVQNWHGTVKITGTGSGTSTGAPYSDVWQFGVTSSVTFQLDTYNPNIQGWTGPYAGTSNINAKDVATLAGCDQTFTQTFQGPIPLASPFTLVLRGTNQYVFYPYGYEVQGAASSTVNSCVPGTVGGQGPATWSPVLSNLIQTLPATGFSLVGSTTVKMDSPMQPMSLLFGGSPAQIDAKIDWDIEPGLDTPPEVVVQKTSALQNWRPTAGAGGGAGASIDLVAKLQAKGGGSTNVTAAYFTWELTQSSKEPGYAMNAPVANPGTDFDLKLESGPDGLFLTDPNAQKAESKPGVLTQSTVTVTSYDWGAFGKIKVTAHLPDGSQLVGYLDGDPSQTEVRLPLRSDSSLIADVWKQNHGVAGLADINDNESDPPGDGHPGDGLTLYEEYRGFIIDGQHAEGNPKKKDFFILNHAGVFYQGAFRMFQSLSGLEVHYKLRDSELASDRVINRNHNQGAHIVDQHAIFTTPIAANAGYFEALGGPGTPGMISQVLTPRILPGATASVDYNLSSLAHELLHACNVYHHGDKPFFTTFLTRLSTDQVLASPTNGGGGVPTTVLTETGASAASLLPVNSPVKAILGAANDVHTGDDNCVMRYDDAVGYFSKANPATIYYTPGEGAGFSICTSSAGTGVNDPGRTPQARYGDAAPGRGNCVGQILVNDAVPAPRR